MPRKISDYTVSELYAMDREELLTVIRNEQLRLMEQRSRRKAASQRSAYKKRLQKMVDTL